MGETIKFVPRPWSSGNGSMFALYRAVPDPTPKSNERVEAVLYVLPLTCIAFKAPTPNTVVYYFVLCARAKDSISERERMRAKEGLYY